MVTSKNKVIFYTILDTYINDLKKVDNKVQNNYNGQRLYYKTKLKVKGEDINYYVPLSSAKESQKNINNKSMFKIYGDNEKKDFLGVLHINNMIPVPNKFADPWAPNNKYQDKRYIMLVVKQAKYLFEFPYEINFACKILYDSKTNKVDSMYFKENRKEVMLYKRITNDVRLLEMKSIQENIKIREERLILNG